MQSGDKFCSACATPLELRQAAGRPRPVCPSCGRVVYYDPKITATAIVQRQGQVLLIRRANEVGYGLWSMPGGYVLANERSSYYGVVLRQQRQIEDPLSQRLGVPPLPLRSTAKFRMTDPWPASPMISTPMLPSLTLRPTALTGYPSNTFFFLSR